MRGSFEAAFDEVIRHEGDEIVNGRKRYGVEKSTYANVLGAFEEEVDLARLHINLAQSIHRAVYWDKVKGDLLPAGLDLMLYDAAVCHGPLKSVIWLQSILRDRQDGEISGRTLGGVNSYISRYTLITLINTFKKERLWQIDRHLENGSPEARNFGAKMRNRVDAVTKKACNLAVRA